MIDIIGEPRDAEPEEKDKENLPEDQDRPEWKEAMLRTFLARQRTCKY